MSYHNKIMTNIQKRQNYAGVNNSSPASSSEISAIHPRPQAVLKQRIQALEQELQQLYEYRKKSAAQTRKHIASLQQDIKLAKELLSSAVKEETLLKLQGEVIAEESNQTHRLLIEVNRRSSKRFERRKQLNDHKIRLTKEIEKSLKEHDRCAVSRKVLGDQIREMDKEHKEMLCCQKDVLKKREEILSKMVNQSQKCDDQRGILKILSDAHLQADKRNTTEKTLIASAHEMIKEMEQIALFNSSETERYNSLVRKEQTKNQERAHHIENRKVEEAMLDEELQSLNGEIDDKTQVFNGFQHGIELLEKFLGETEKEKNLYLSTNQELMKRVEDLSMEEIGISHKIQDSKQSRKDVISRLQRLVQ